MRALLVVAILCSIYFRSGHTQVTLSHVGEVQVCGRSNHYPSKLRTLSLTCTTRDSVLWSTSGFGEGLDNQTRVSALSLANTSLRVTTADTSTQTNTSSITLTNFNYGDHRATVTCEDYLSTDRQSVTISVGPPNCTVSLTVSRVTADGAVIRWAIHNCIGSAPTIYVFYWFPIGKPPSLSTWNSAFVNASSETNQYNITGLSSRTKYYLEFQVHDSCGFINVHTELVDVLMPIQAQANPTTFGLVAVTVVLFLLLLLLSTTFLIICMKSKSKAAATKKENAGSGGGGGGLELSKKDESPYKA